MDTEPVANVSKVSKIPLEQNLDSVGAIYFHQTPLGKAFKQTMVKMGVSEHDEIFKRLFEKVFR